MGSTLKPNQLQNLLELGFLDPDIIDGRFSDSFCSNFRKFPHGMRMSSLISYGIMHNIPLFLELSPTVPEFWDDKFVQFAGDPRAYENSPKFKPSRTHIVSTVMALLIREDFAGLKQFQSKIEPVFGSSEFSKIKEEITLALEEGHERTKHFDYHGLSPEDGASDAQRHYATFFKCCVAMGVAMIKMGLSLCDIYESLGAQRGRFEILKDNQNNLSEALSFGTLRPIRMGESITPISERYPSAIDTARELLEGRGYDIDANKAYSLCNVCNSARVFDITISTPNGSSNLTTSIVKDKISGDLFWVHHSSIWDKPDSKVMINQYADCFRDPARSDDDIIQTAAQLHHTLSHMMPFQRGSAAVTEMIVSAYLLSAGISVPKTAAASSERFGFVMPDVLALVTPNKEEYVPQFIACSQTPRSRFAAALEPSYKLEEEIAEVHALESYSKISGERKYHWSPSPKIRGDRSKEFLHLKSPTPIEAA